MAYAYPIYNNGGVNYKSFEDKYIYDKENLSGPEELRGKDKNKNIYYCLDLSEKYHNKSPLKPFHLVTFYFQNSFNKKGIKPVIIRAQLPKQISYSVGGEWGAPISLGQGGMLKGIIEVARGQTIDTTFDTTKIWMNPKPLTIQLDMPIFDDTEDKTDINFQEALQVFGRATLPEMTKIGMFKSTPGPSFGTALANRQDNAEFDKNHDGISKTIKATNKLLGGDDKDLDRITVQIGGMLLVDWVAITNFTVTYPNTKQQLLHSWVKSNSGFRKNQLLPQTAMLSVTIETVTGLTRTSYDNMLNLHSMQKLGEKNEEAQTKAHKVNTNNLQLTGIPNSELTLNGTTPTQQGFSLK
jgi:hypothetical protein